MSAMVSMAGWCEAPRHVNIHAHTSTIGGNTAGLEGKSDATLGKQIYVAKYTRAK